MISRRVVPAACFEVVCQTDGCAEESLVATTSNLAIECIVEHTATNIDIDIELVVYTQCVVDTSIVGYAVIRRLAPSVYPAQTDIRLNTPKTILTVASDHI